MHHLIGKENLPKYEKLKLEATAAALLGADCLSLIDINPLENPELGRKSNRINVGRASITKQREDRLELAWMRPSTRQMACQWPAIGNLPPAFSWLLRKQYGGCRNGNKGC